MEGQELYCAYVRRESDQMSETVVSNCLSPVVPVARHVDIFCSASVAEQGNVETLLIPSLARSSGGISISLHLVDYTGTNRLAISSTDEVAVSVYKNEKQLGFGAAHNFLFARVKPAAFFVIINPDIYCSKGLVENLLQASEEGRDIGIVEARQLPYAHPKGYDRKTMETTWASGACMLVNPKFYAQAGGFDEAFWMYCEDVELSWRCWLSGYRVIHCPRAVAYHYTGGYFEYRDDRFYCEQLWGGVNFLYLSYRYWGSLRLWRSVVALKLQGWPKPLVKRILREFKARKRAYSRAAGFPRSLSSQRDRIGIIGYNRYKEAGK